MNINKFTNNIDNAPYHSSGYAEVAGNSRMGAASPQSFTQRLHIERNRQSVGRYHNSMLANGHHRAGQYERIQTTTPQPRDVTGGSAARPAAASRFERRRVGDSNSSVVRPVGRQNFSEPPTRGYNPYQ